MVEYTPPPKDLSHLNPIQRYMQKGSLDPSDYLRLIAVVALYWFLRPYVQRLAKKYIGGEEFKEGEEEAEAYKQRRAAAKVNANEIRSGKQKPEGKTLGQLLDDGTDAFKGDAATSGAMTGGGEAITDVKNRKQQKDKKGVSFAPEKDEVDKTLDWEDENELDPRRKPLSSDEQQEAVGGDIKQWMEKWTA